LKTREKPLERSVHIAGRIDEVTFENLPSACNERDGVMSGLVNGVLAGTGAF
jgi:hypothetical protein